MSPAFPLPPTTCSLKPVAGRRYAASALATGTASRLAATMCAPDASWNAPEPTVMDTGLGTSCGGAALAWGCALGWLGAADAAVAAEATTARPTAAATRPLRDGRAGNNDMGASFRLGSPRTAADRRRMWSRPIPNVVYTTWDARARPRQQLPNISRSFLRRICNSLASDPARFDARLG